jgi:hypothetical protein
MPNGEFRFDNRHLPFHEITDGIFKPVYNTKLFNKMNTNKYKYKEIYCISLQAITNAVYVEEEEVGNNDWFEDDDENDP